MNEASQSTVYIISEKHACCNAAAPGHIRVREQGILSAAPSQVPLLMPDPKEKTNQTQHTATKYFSEPHSTRVRGTCTLSAAMSVSWEWKLELESHSINQKP